jgi:hypothetical protein
MSLLALSSNTTKNAILRILSEEWPLTMKKIHSRIKRGKAMTYQAVYKALRELLSIGVLAREGNQYMISPSWVEQSAMFFEKLAGEYEKDYSGSRRLQELNFNSLNEAWEFLLSKLNTDFFGESGEAYLQLRRFFLIPLSKEDIARLKDFASRKKVYVLCRNRTIIDKIAGNFLGSLGAKVFLGVPCANPTNVFVNGNCVVSIYVIGEKERRELSDKYLAANSSEASRLKFFTDIFMKRVTVKLVINRDPGVLSDVIEQTRAILSRQPC